MEDNEQNAQDYVTVSLKLQDSEAVRFQIKNNICLGKVMKVFKQFTGNERSEFRYLLDGQRLMEEDTPKSLNLANGDVIEVYRQQTGGADYNLVLFKTPDILY